MATPRLLPAVDPIGVVKPIQGKMPDSVEEYRFSISLEKLDLRYDFQVPVFGGRSRRGGTIIDFVVDTAPLKTPVFIDGGYFHNQATAAKQDEIIRARIRQAFRGTLRDPVSIADTLLKDQSASDAVARLIFGYG